MRYKLDPTIAPYENRLPAQTVRFGKGGGLPAPDGKRARFRDSFAALLRMVKHAWDRKIRSRSVTAAYSSNHP